MPFVPDEHRDQRLEAAMGLLLRAGVVTAAAIAAVGGALLLRHPWARVPEYHHFRPPDPQLISGESFSSIRALFHALPGGSSASIIALALLVLIATPVARVAFAIVGFARERDWLYTAVSLVVLSVLLFSLLHGR